jgi:hypothetical protein
MHLASWVVSPLYAGLALLCLVGLAILVGSAAHVGSSPSESASPPVQGHSSHIELTNSATYFTCVYPRVIHMTSASSAVICESGPLVSSLRPGSSAAQARGAAENSGYEIPPNYVAEPATNGQGWVFRAPGTTGNAYIIRVGEANALNPSGYVRYYNSGGQPLDWEGNPGPASDTHLPLRSEPETPATPENPLGDDFFDLGFTATVGEIIYA